MAQGIRFDAAQSRCVTYDLPEPLTESQIYTLGKLSARARYNADHVRAGATAEERRNLQDKAEALEAALKLAEATRFGGVICGHQNH